LHRWTIVPEIVSRSRRKSQRNEETKLSPRLYGGDTWWMIALNFVDYLGHPVLLLVTSSTKDPNLHLFHTDLGLVNRVFVTRNDGFGGFGQSRLQVDVTSRTCKFRVFVSVASPTD
jgi:hypothetical protein